MPEITIETRTCRACQSSFSITDRDMEFYAKVSPTFNGKKELVPPPTMCPECRQQKRLAFRNERKLYRRTCDLTGREVISMLSPDKPYTVYHQDDWWGDGWDVLEYGREFDSSRGFFEQFRELSMATPRMSLTNAYNEHSPFTNYTGSSKHVYLCGDAYECEDTYYSNTVKHTQDCMDLTDTEKAVQCYECITSKDLYHCAYAYYSQQCSESTGIYGCRNVQNCLFCVDLHDVGWYIFNEKSTKDKVDRLRMSIRDHATRTECLT